MIRYPVSRQDLDDAIDRASSTWRHRARQRTEELASGTRQRITPMWSEIKKVYSDLQGAKCAFCEKWLERQPVELDVEHFRPKRRVRRWRVPAALRREGVQPRQSGDDEPSYELLAYDPWNYVVACKSCNSALKRDHFPIAGTRNPAARTSADFRAEQAYLIYPLGDIDEDPEELIEFHGLSPQPRCAGFDRHRALVTIAIFGLDDFRKRFDLLHARAQRLEYLFFALRLRDDRRNSAEEVRVAEQAIERLVSSRSVYANCLRCYLRLWESNRSEAEAIANRITTLLQSLDGEA